MLTSIHALDLDLESIVLVASLHKDITATRCARLQACDRATCSERHTYWGGEGVRRSGGIVKLLISIRLTK